MLSERTLQALIDGVTDSLILMDADGTVLAVNAAAAARVGRLPPEMVSISAFDFLPTELGRQRAEHVRRVVETREPVRYEDAMQGRSFRNAIYPVVQAGRVAQLVVSSAEVTELREAERRLEDSERHYRLLAENASDVVFRADGEGLFEWVSPSVEELLGWAPAQLLGRPMTELVHPDDLPTLFAVRRGLQGGRPSHYEARLRTADAGHRWLAVTVSDVADADGTAARVGSWRDVQAEVEARQALSASEKRYRILTESSPDFIFIVDRQYCVRYLNPTAGTAFGRAPDELVGMTLDDLFGAQNAARMGESLGLVFDTGEPCRTESQWDVPWGTTWLATWLVPIRGEDGAVREVFGVSRDVTDLKHTQKELAELNAALERRVAERTAQLKVANDELEAFAYSVSHDLRAPLRAIDGFSQILIEEDSGALGDEGVANLERVRGATRRMTQLIDALLVLSRLSRKDLDIGSIDLSRRAAHIVAQLREQQPERRVEVLVAPGCKVAADADLIDVVLTNLLGNAWKFTSLRDDAHIEFGVLSRDGERVFYVRDDGAGFEQQYAHTLFQPFRRLHAAEEFPGTGIGLATVRRIVARLGGRCWAEGEPDKGATFFFTLGGPPPEATPADRSEATPGDRADAGQ